MGAEVLANMLALTPQYYHEQLVSIGGLQAGEMLNWFVHEAGFRLKPTALLETVASADAALLDALFIVGGDGQRILDGVLYAQPSSTQNLEPIDQSNQYRVFNNSIDRHQPQLWPDWRAFVKENSRTS